MAQDIPRTTYLPEVEEDARKERERRTVQEGTATWKRRKEELQRQNHREQREVCVVNDCYTKARGSFTSVAFAADHDPL